MTDTETQTLTTATSSLNGSSDKNNNNMTGKSMKIDEANVEAEATTNGDDQATTTASKDDNELILVQENAFTVKIQVPGMDSFDLQVTAMELVQEIHQMLMDKEETCHRTCFSLQLDGVTLDNFSELKAIEGIREGSVIKLVEEPYNVREVRLHVRHINDLMHSIDQIDNFNAVNCNSLTYVNEITNGDINDKRASKEPINDYKPLDFILPNNKDIPLLPLHLNATKVKQPACLKQLTFSGWNPPPGKRKMKGDLMYLHVITAEDKRYHLTASLKGFYVNQSTDDVFNPKQDTAHKLQHSLVDLFNTLSNTFKKNFSAIQKKRTQKHPFERIGTPFQVYTWLSADYEHTVDWFRAEDSNASKLGHEDHIPGHSRDWNEEIQATKELPKKSLPERLIRERAMFKVHSDFVNAATRGAIAVIENNIMAINPGEDSKIQMYIWNNMFFSLGFDVKDHYKEFGGDYAAYSAPINDLQGVKALNALDIDELHALGTVVIDYKGFRVTAQSIIPGILDKDQEQSVVHGSTDFGKTCATNTKYNELLEKVCVNLKMRPHKIRVENNDEIMLHSSIECKGIVGNDSRYYLLDLLRMFPPDLNYLPTEENDKMSEEVKKLGFPRKFRHKLCSLRQELIESFVDAKYIQFVKHAAIQIQQMNSKKAAVAQMEADEQSTSTLGGNSSSDLTEQEKEIEEAKQIVKQLANTSVEENSVQIIQNACKHVNSFKDTEFDIRFNPNLFQPIVKLADEPEKIEADKKMLNEACEYLLTVQVPMLIKDLLEHAIFITDGVTLCEALHSRGINLRYLGYVLEKMAKNETLSYIYSIGMCELVSRCSKRIFRQYIQGVSGLSMSAAVAHYLNSYLSLTFKSSNNTVTVGVPVTNANGSPPNVLTNGLVTSNDLTTIESAGSKANVKKNRKKNQKKNNRNSFQDQLNNDWSNLTPRTLWSQIAEEAQAQYHFDLKLENNEEQSFAKLKLRKFTLLRSFCQKNGVQLLLRDYNFETKHKETFHEDDILNLYPIVKHVPTKASDAANFFANGQAKIQQGLLKEGYELISESYNLFTNVYGALHPEICMCLRLLSRLNYILGDYVEALSTQHKAVMMCERLFGVDHSQTITEYTHLSLYCFANGQIANALKLLYRARYLLLINYGEDHPEMSLIDNNLGLILQAANEYESALKFLENGLEISRKYFGAKSMKTALSFHLLARLQSCRGDFRTALMNERETYQIYKALLGEEHERTKESAQVLKHLTEQAVLLQKKMNEMYKGEKVSFTPIQIQQPSMQTVLAMLNIINGIIFLGPSHEEELERIRIELSKYQQNRDNQSINGLEKSKTPDTNQKINTQDDDLQ